MFAKFLDSSGNELPNGILSPYLGQYGLQGKIFRLAFRIVHNGDLLIQLSHLFCSLMLAVTASIICILVKKKYNLLMAASFYIVFWLSPWIIDFARNLYWVEFTWFIPMAVGLYCAIHITSRKARIISYLLAFISILTKSLCGYEYISAVMMGLIFFLSADFVVYITKKDTKQAKILIRTIFLIGIMALLGFITAICIHAQIRGDDDIIEGLTIIFKNDVLRRTMGANLNNFYSTIYDSINASVWDTVSKYFSFNTEVIVGIPGNLFQVLCIIPIVIFVHDHVKHTLKINIVALYIISFITSISWIVLAKSHSYIHTHINFVLWYFGFVQICIYVICDKFLRVVNTRRGEE